MDQVIRLSGGSGESECSTRIFNERFFTDRRREGANWERGRLARRFRPLAESSPSESSRRDADCGDRDGRAPQSQSNRRGWNIHEYFIKAY